MKKKKMNNNNNSKNSRRGMQDTLQEKRHGSTKT